MAGCTAFLLGTAAGRHVSVAGWTLLPMAACLLTTLRRRTYITILCIVITGFACGLWRGNNYFARLQPYRTYALQKVTLTATVSTDGYYEYEKPMSFLVGGVHINGKSVPGHIKVSGYGENMVYRGDVVQVSGKLYPTRGANQASIGYAQIHKLSSGGSPIDTFRRKFAAAVQSTLPEPEASFGLGLLVGQRNTLPADVTQALLMVGLTHIIAVSGYNLTILLEASRRILGNHSKVLSMAVALALIFGFLAVAGNSASIVRAAVISLLSLSAWYYGRTVRPLLLILLAAAGTGYANPVYVWGDLSWWLSFLAFFGILVLGPIVTHKLYGDRQPPLIPQVLIESLCAEIMTLPLVLYIFGQMSLVSLLANMLVVALIPLAMLLGFVAGLAGMLIGAVSGWFAWPARILLTYMLDIVELLSRIPHVFVQDKYLSAMDMVLCYVAVVLLVVLFHWRQRRHKRFGTNIETVR